MALRQVGNSSTLKRILSGALGGGSDALNLQALLGQQQPEGEEAPQIGPSSFGPAPFEPVSPGGPVGGDGELSIEDILALLQQLGPRIGG